MIKHIKAGDVHCDSSPLTVNFKHFLKLQPRFADLKIHTMITFPCHNKIKEHYD